MALESLNIVANNLAPAAAAPPPARAIEQAGGSRYDARNDITQRKIDKRRQQRASRVGFEGDDSDEDSPDGESESSEGVERFFREKSLSVRLTPTRCRLRVTSFLLEGRRGYPSSASSVPGETLGPVGPGNSVSFLLESVAWHSSIQC